MSSSPPPPYTPSPPPYIRRSRTNSQKKSSPSPPPPLPPPPPSSRQQKSSSCPSCPMPTRTTSPSPPRCRRPTSRELLTDALRRAQRAVELDSAESDVPAAIVAYDDAIALLQGVIERRSKKAGCSSEVERVTSIHDRYVERVRELCHIHRITLPSHVFPVPTTITAEDSPSKPESTTTSHLPDPIQTPLPDSPPPPTPSAIIGHLTFEHHQSHPTYAKNHNKDVDEDDNDNDHYGDDETEREPGLSPCSSKSATPETQSPISPADENDGREVEDNNPRRWILSAACDEELMEWGQYLDEPGKNNRRLSDATAASSAGWSAIALSCGECVSIIR